MTMTMFGQIMTVMAGQDRQVLACQQGLRAQVMELAPQALLPMMAGLAPQALLPMMAGRVEVLQDPRVLRHHRAVQGRPRAAAGLVRQGAAAAQVARNNLPLLEGGRPQVSPRWQPSSLRHRTMLMRASCNV